MEPLESVVSIGSFITILIAPLLGPFGISYGFVDNTIIRLLLVLFVVYAIRLGQMPGLLAFLAAYSLMIERNHEVLTLFPNQKPLWPFALGNPFPKQAPPLVGVHEVIPFDTTDHQEGHAVVETHGESSVTNEFEKAEDLHDNIPRIAEAPRTDAAPEFYKSKGLLS